MTGAWHRSLRFRLTLTVVAVLAGSLTAATAIVFELLLVSGRADLEEVLQRERSRFQQSVGNIIASPGDQAALRAAIVQYLELNPASESYLTVARIDGDELATDGGPVELLRLRARGALPLTAANQVEAVDTAEGPVLSLVAPVILDDREAATVQIAGPLAPIREESFQALRSLVLVAALGLLLGGGLLAVTLRRSLAPLSQLAATARSTELQDLSSRVRETDRVDEVGLLAREFNHMLERLQREVRSRQTFLASVSHELRTPVTIARGHVEILESTAGRQPDRALETAAVIGEELSRMTRLVDDLMALARSESDEFVVPAPLDLTRFFEDLKLRLIGLGIDGVTVQEPPDGIVSADADRLAQAVMNLVVNASVHTPPGTTIEVGATMEPGGVACLQVRDDGGGVDPAVRHEAFEPFVRGGEATGGSTGLGLAVVAAIARAHGGSVAMDTSPAGTVVTVRLPAR